ncbi:LysE family translocator [Actinokineospora xionganensis]|uniref:LysE family translocator n=1 Tax=Actinokineospora xionganensis TaxID=2684470 RepID=A0ABR7L4R4_9PSEU|nr:LysE family translocator [Actinokineospora xionganensis]MBC6447671.1 LysE family translocator [Actinokineospora xionganensis]
MSGAALLGYTLAAFLLTITPGLDTLLILRSVLSGGRRAGFAVGVGITAGCVLWGTASIAGLTALLAASPVAYDVVRYAGAAYLLWLGASGLWQSWRRREEPEAFVPVSGAFRTGLMTNLLNPKIGVFYVSLLPQFVPASSASAAWAALLVAIHVGLGLLWQAGLIWFGGQARTALTRPTLRRVTERVAASVLLAFGLKVALGGR